MLFPNSKTDLGREEEREEKEVAVLGGGEEALEQRRLRHPVPPQLRPEELHHGRHVCRQHLRRAEGERDRLREARRAQCGQGGVHLVEGAVQQENE